VGVEMEEVKDELEADEREDHRQPRGELDKPVQEA
jgi:hypothetical protein